jgi:hypothetical protein
MLYSCYFRESLPAFLLTLGFRRFACAPTISAFGFPYLVILMRSPCTASSTNSSNLLFASVNPTVSMTLDYCKSSAKSCRTQEVGPSMIATPAGPPEYRMRYHRVRLQLRNNR